MTLDDYQYRDEYDLPSSVSINRKLSQSDLATFLQVPNVSDDLHAEYLKFMQTGQIPDFAALDATTREE